MASTDREAVANTAIEWQHLPALDGVRAVAVGGVLAFHAGAGWMRGGFLGVDLFFVLSGWLITGLLLHERSTGGRIDVVAFWGRRARRLVPAVLALIAAVVVWWTLMAPATERLAVLRDAPWAQFYVANWHQIASHAGYWASFDAPSPLAHLWSLAIEEQFYLFWPLALALVLVAGRRPGRAVLGLCLAGVAASVVASWLLSGDGDMTRTYMGTDTRAASLLLGGAFATGPVRRAALWAAARARRAVDPMLAVIAVALTAMWVTVDGSSASWLFRGGLLAHSLLAATAIAVVVASPSSRVARMLGWRPLRWVGVRSYSLYLWHWPVFVWLSPERTGLSGPQTTALRLTVAFALADVSYGLIENPIRRRARWAHGWRGSVALAGAMATAATLVAVIPRAPVGPERPDAAAVAQALSQPVSQPASQPVGFPAGIGESAAAAFATPVGVLVVGERQMLATTRPTSPDPSVTAPAPTTVTEPAPAPSEPVPAPSEPAPAPSEPVPAPSEPVPAPATTAALERLTIESVAWFGDSIATDAAPGLEAALEASGLKFHSYAFAGESLSGNLFIDEESWLHEKIPKALSKGNEDLVAWQLSMWDYPAPADVKEATLTWFVELALAEHQAVLFVSAPPLENTADEAGKHELEQAAQTVAARYPGQVWFADARAVWGDTYVHLDESGQPLRKSDGTHMCPLGAARFAAWLIVELAARFDGITPADPAVWATGWWWKDSRYRKPQGACVVG